MMAGATSVSFWDGDRDCAWSRSRPESVVGLAALKDQRKIPAFTISLTHSRARGSRARSPSLKCQSAHTPQPPLGQRFRSARADSPHSCAPAPPDRNRWPRRRPRAHEETWRKGETRPPFPSRFEERSRSADSKIQQSASTSEGCPAASCCERRLAKSSATADLQVPNRKQRRASPSASIGDQGDQELAARRSATARRPIKSPITQPEMPARTHAPATPWSAVSIGSRRTVPVAARRRRRIETAGRGAALARTRKRGGKVKRGGLFASGYFLQCAGDGRTGRFR